MSVTVGASIAGAVLLLGGLAAVAIVIVAVAYVMFRRSQKAKALSSLAGPAVDPQPVMNVPIHHYTPRNPRHEQIDFEVDVASRALRKIMQDTYEREVIDKAKAAFEKA